MTEHHTAMTPRIEGGGFPGPSARPPEQEGGILRRENALVPETIRRNLSARIQIVLFGWNKYLGRTENRFIIDAYHKDTISVNPQEVEEISTGEAIPELRGHIDEINKLGLMIRTEWEAARLGITAVILTEEERARQERGEPKTPFSEYYPAVSGDDLALIPQWGLEEPRESLLRLLSYSEPFDFNNDRSAREVARSYHLRTRITSKSEIIRLFRDNDMSQRGRLRVALKAPVIDRITYRFEWKDDRGEPYMVWERGDNSGYYLVLNEGRLKDWNLGEAERYPIHEVLGHFGMLAVQSEEIKEGKVDDIAGVLLIPDQRCWGFEGFAQTLDTFAGLKLTRHGELSMNFYRMYVRARSNAILMLEEGAKMEDVMQMMQRYSFHKTEYEVLGELMKSQTSPFWRGYLRQYGTSDFLMMNMGQNLNEEARLAFLRIGFRQPMVRNRLLQTAAFVLLGSNPVTS